MIRHVLLLAPVARTTRDEVEMTRSAWTASQPSARLRPVPHIPLLLRPARRAATHTRRCPMKNVLCSTLVVTALTVLAVPVAQANCITGGGKNNRAPMQTLLHPGVLGSSSLAAVADS